MNESNLVSHCSLLSLGVHVNVRQTMSVYVFACTYVQVCVTIFFSHLILSFREEITHNGFYSILGGTSGKDSRKQGNDYYHLVSRWEKRDMELRWGLLFGQASMAELNITFPQEVEHNQNPELCGNLNPTRDEASYNPATFFVVQWPENRQTGIFLNGGIVSKSSE